MGQDWPLDWGIVAEVVFPILLGALVFVIGIQVLVSAWLDRAAGPRFPNDPFGT